MSVLKSLTEGIVNRDLEKEGRALLNKWERTGLLEGIDNDYGRQCMSRLLENQAKQLLKEASSMAAGDVEGFSSVAFPIVRRVFGGLIANDLVSVQPMSLPSGLIFFLDFTYESSRFGNNAGNSIYGTDRVASQITAGVNLVDSTYGASNGGPYNMGGSYSSPSGSTLVCSASNANFTPFGFELSSSLDSDLTRIKYDPDLRALSSSNYVLELKALKTGFHAQADYNNLSAFSSSMESLNAVVSTTHTAANTKQVRRLTKVDSDSVYLYFSTTADVTAVADGTGLLANLSCSVPIKDNFDAASAIGAIVGLDPWGLEEPTPGSGKFGSDTDKNSIPEIDIKVDSIAVTAQTKKLKAKWSPELGQDLNAYHNLDAEVELTSILSEQIALEIDREILQDLVNGATAGTYYWSRSPGMFLHRTTGAEVGASAKAPDFTGNVSEWYETLVETINDVSAQIHRKTLRGGANFLVCSPEVANILEFTSGFRASITADVDKGTVGAVKAGSLSKKWEVYVDPYFHRNLVLVGRKGSSFLESGYVYAPYVPLQVTPTIFGVEDFIPRKGVMTRYAKKMVRPDLYGLVVVRGMLGESGG
jgi:hypothetical protein